MRGWISAKTALKAAMNENYKCVMLAAMALEVLAFIYLCVVETMQWIDERSLRHLLEELSRPLR